VTLSQDQLDHYNEHGYVVIENAAPKAHLDAIIAEVDRMIAGADRLTESNDSLDLDPAHTPQAPRVRRIKSPHLYSEFFHAHAANKMILDALDPILPSGIRLHNSKVNMKSAGHGESVEWHQDWAFYPHSNQDVLAVGIYLDDCGLENGPMLVLPGSHKGPVYDHHAQGYFCGAMDPTQCDLDFEKAVPLMGPAGTMTIHHARLVHGSAYNTSNKPRRFLLQSYAAADAWPLHELKGGLDAYEDRLVRGEQCMTPRMEDVPVRIPLPFRPDATVGSIYDNQSALENRYFDAAE